MSFWGNVGDKVRFKNSRNGGIDWTIDYIELNCDNVKWSKGGKVPNFIKLRRTVYLAGGKTRNDYVWTSTNQLKEP